MGWEEHPLFRGESYTYIAMNDASRLIAYIELLETTNAALLEAIERTKP